MYRSPTELAWEKIFSGDLTEDKASIVASMFDDDEFLQSRQFTVLHKIVLGLIPKQLQVRNAACCNILLAHGANIAARNSYGHTALHAVTRGKGSLPLLDALVKAGIDINVPDHSGETALRNTTVTMMTNMIPFSRARGLDPAPHFSTTRWNSRIRLYL